MRRKQLVGEVPGESIVIRRFDAADVHRIGVEVDRRLRQMHVRGVRP